VFATRTSKHNRDRVMFRRLSADVTPKSLTARFGRTPRPLHHILKVTRFGIIWMGVRVAQRFTVPASRRMRDCTSPLACPVIHPLSRAGIRGPPRQVLLIRVVGPAPCHVCPRDWCWHSALELVKPPASDLPRGTSPPNLKATYIPKRMSVIFDTLIGYPAILAAVIMSATG
jgi:hypothetical protein